MCFEGIVESKIEHDYDDPEHDYDEVNTDDDVSVLASYSFAFRRC